MPPSINPAHVSFNVSFKDARATSPIDPDAPLRIVILGNFSGRADAAGNCARQVDCDNFDAICAQFAASLQLPPCAAGSADIDIAFSHLDDFHPDHLLRKIPALSILVELRTRLLDPGSSSAAVAELRGILTTGTLAPEVSASKSASQESTADMVARLLGKPAAEVSAPAGPQSVVDRLIQQAVSSSAVPAADPAGAHSLAALDAELTARLRCILSHPDFQALESAWRGLDFLVREAGENVKLHAIDVSREDLDRQIASIDNPAASTIGRQLEPLAPAVILCAFSFGVKDTDALSRIAQLAAACDTAFIGGARPDLVGCASFASQPNPIDWDRSARSEQSAFAKLRRAPEANRIGLALPRFVIRQPYGKESDPIQTIPFEELAPGASPEGYLWANPAFLCGHLLLNSFASDGWEMELGGPGGEICGLPVHSFRINGEKQTTPCAEAWLSEKAAEAILGCGLMPVLSVRGRDCVRLVSLRSISEPERRLSIRIG